MLLSGEKGKREGGKDGAWVYQYMDLSRVRQSLETRLRINTGSQTCPILVKFRLLRFMFLTLSPRNPPWFPSAAGVKCQTHQTPGGQADTAAIFIFLLWTRHAPWLMQLGRILLWATEHTEGPYYTLS